MSLEAALEEERLGVMKILEEQERKKKEKRANAHHKRSTSDGSHQQQPRRPVSLLLNEEPLDLDDPPSEKQRSNSAVGHKSLVLSPPASPTMTKSMLSPREDPTDPLASPDSYYYKAEQLRPRLRSPSPRKSGGGRSLSSYAIMDRKKAPHTNNKSVAVTDEDLSKQFRHAYRRLSATHLSKADGALGELYKEKRLQKDYDEESGSSDDDDDDYDEDDEEDSDEPASAAASTSSQDPFISARSSLIMDDANVLLKNSNVPKSESPQNVQRLKYKSLLEVDPAAAASAAEYAAHKRRIIHPNTAFEADDNGTQSSIAYTSDHEELQDAKKAAEMTPQISPIHSNLTTQRAVRSMRRGDLPALSDPATPRQKSYVISTDLSPEATHALEWTIGTVIRDGNVLYVLCAFEDDPQAQASDQEEERLQALEKMTKQVSKLLQKTRLQVHVILEAIHCKTPKHMLVEIIDYVSPTLVILGSRGRSALKGVLLGSFSNYIVERSSVPVMVARRKLQKTKHKDLNVRLANNLRPRGTGFAGVKID